MSTYAMKMMMGEWLSSFHLNPELLDQNFVRRKQDSHERGEQVAERLLVQCEINEG